MMDFKDFIYFGIVGAILTCGFAQQDIPEFLCAGVPIDRYVRNVTACNGWIRCKEDNNHISGYCPEPYFFDEFNQYCSTANNVDCYTCPDPNNLLAFYPVKNSCNRYIRCLRGVATEHICDEGLYFNSADGGSCEPEDDVECILSDKLECPKVIKAGSFYALNDAADCSIGIVCVGDTDPIEIKCNPVLHFNTKNLQCVNPANSGCTDGHTSPPTTAPPTTTTTTTTTTTSGNPPIES